ncbi:MAG: hypothetical protein DWH99_05970 [Planctomycetota bacterium]|nr:MAG: hypothetical protein DWH99_05970 [Planctomycetota bacterium]
MKSVARLSSEEVDRLVNQTAEILDLAKRIGTHQYHCDKVVEQLRSLHVDRQIDGFRTRLPIIPV